VAGRPGARRTGSRDLFALNRRPPADRGGTERRRNLNVELTWWMAALIGVGLAVLPSLIFIWGKTRPRRNIDPELQKVNLLSRALAKGKGSLSSGQNRKIRKADPETMCRVLIRDFDYWTGQRQQAVIEALRELGYIGQGLQWIESRDPDQRIMGADLLGYLRATDGVMPLLKTLADPKEEVRWVASGALRRIGDSSTIPQLIRALEPPHNVTPARVGEVLISFGPAAVGPIREALGRVGEQSRGALISVLGEIGGEQSLTTLIAYLSDQSSWVRACAAEALGKLGEAAAGPALAQALADESPEIRSRAAQALGTLGWPEAIPILQRSCKDEDWAVRTSANQALKELRRRSGGKG